MTAQCQALVINTEGRSLVDVTDKIGRIVGHSQIAEGIANVFIKHTSASLIVSENADPDVLVDLERYMSDLVVDGDARFRHRAEGPDDMAAHIRSVLTSTSVTLPVRSGRLQLGTWQAIYLWEHRSGPHRRTLEVSILG